MKYRHIEFEEVRKVCDLLGLDPAKTKEIRIGSAFGHHILYSVHPPEVDEK